MNPKINIIKAIKDTVQKRIPSKYSRTRMPNTESVKTTVSFLKNKNIPPKTLVFKKCHKSFSKYDAGKPYTHSANNLKIHQNDNKVLTSFYNQKKENDAPGGTRTRATGLDSAQSHITSTALEGRHPAARLPAHSNFLVVIVLFLGFVFLNYSLNYMSSIDHCVKLSYIVVRHYPNFI